MSADNGIYIFQTKDGYRVAHCQAIENISWQPNRKGLNTETVEYYFGKCKVFKTRVQALEEADRLYEEIMKSDCPINRIWNFFH
ncbi:unnamed protein product [marine sediment metagenome]|uniref:Uncharacterized protein n=1 Tax=marine sediment metagenome TaxID=412755 RepID=X0Y4G6_9ZZZZ